MRTVAPGIHWNQKGFTLIEILIVVLIIGIVIGVALVAPNFSGPGQRLKDESVRLQVLIGQARERALMEDQELGLSLTKTGYQWWQWSRDKEKWKLLKEQSYRSYKLPDDIVLSNLNRKKKVLVVDQKEERPEWIFYSDDRLTPLRLELSLQGDKRRTIILESDGIGPVTSP